MRPSWKLPVAAAAVLLVGVAADAQTPAPNPSAMTFFVTSVGSGRGGDLGGLAGADAHCQQLAAAAGAGSRTWRAYLSTQGAGAVNARDRIGNGPWTNARGAVIARSVAELHSDSNNLNQQTALSERGEVLNGRSEKPNPNLGTLHDMLTGSQADGTAFAGNEDRTCRNWTSSAEGSAMVGHHDRDGTPGPAPRSWNASHGTPGCSSADLARVGGGGLFYCFAIN
ncbi:hypothetical protein [Falsiroseomonas sp. HW251]|uniref:hypothetical protein n=1 Tax=Falsiroseomonas sp. HW251 TaxID=3390998 RepID=UPI003D30F257